MTLRAFYLLLLATFLSLGLAAAALVREPEILQAKPADQAAFPALQGALQQVRRVEIAWRGVENSFSRDGDGAWRLEQRDYPAQTARLEDLLRGLAALDLAEPRTAKPELYGFLDLNDPGDKDSRAVSVRLVGEGGTPLVEAVIGRRAGRPIGVREDGVFILRGDDKRAWLAAGVVNLPRDVAAWLDKELLALQTSEIAALVVERPGEDPLVARRDGPQESWRGDSPEDAPSLPREDLDKLTGLLGNLTMIDVRAAGDAADAASATLTLETFDGLSLAVSLHRAEEKTYIAFHVPAETNENLGERSRALLERLRPRAAGRWFYISRYDAEKLFPQAGREDASGG